MSGSHLSTSSSYATRKTDEDPQGFPQSYKVQNLEAGIRKFEKILIAQDYITKEFEIRKQMLLQELEETKEEAKKAEEKKEKKIMAFREAIEDERQELNALLQDKERHEKALQQIDEDRKHQLESFRKAEEDRFEDYKTMHRAKELELLNRIKAVNDEIEMKANEVKLEEKLLTHLKGTNRDLLRRFYQLDSS